ncbi:MAG: prepilin-type N-terminal cleavage/methylation domain-containing protein [Myxococcales bacterium]|nr:prepilin-type N-terminal cleavage/methylation domain-containing protein [Myxococcales bacterium]
MSARHPVARRTRVRTHRRERGFTLIEVMIAVGIITVGSLGILAMQTATIRGNSEARMMSIATQRNRTWFDRLERDALLWNRAGQEDAPRAFTRFLREVNTGWRPPLVVPIDEPVAGASRWLSATADFAGRDMPTDAGAVFCTHVELEWAVVGDVIRARSRTVFHRQNGTQFALSQQCSSNAAAITADLASATPSFRAVTSSTLIRWRPL